MKTSSIKFFFRETWLVILAGTIILFASIGNAHAICEQRTNVQTGQTVLFGDCPANMGVPLPTNMYPQGVNLVPVGQGYYGAQNAGNVNFGGLTTTELVGTGIGAAAGLTANSNQGMHAVAGALIGYGIARGVEALTATKPQQVALQQVIPQPTQTSSGNWCVRAGKKYDCGNNIVVIHNGSPQCLPSVQATESGEEICTGIK